jgi:hypothetical protein
MKNCRRPTTNWRRVPELQELARELNGARARRLLVRRFPYWVMTASART